MPNIPAAKIGPKTDPTLADLMIKIKQDVFYSMNCVQIGKIESYNSLSNTAVIAINFKRLLADGSELNYPLLQDCPVVMLGGSGARLSFPIAKGDECLILFNDRNIDDWHYSGQKRVPPDGRAHSLSDGIAIVGIANALTASLTPSNSVCLDGGSKKVAIRNDAATLKTILENLVNCLLSLTVIDAGTTAVPAGTWPIDTTAMATLNTIKTSIAALLDEGLT
jgi:hypothetical protein